MIKIRTAGLLFGVTSTWNDKKELSPQCVETKNG